MPVTVNVGTSRKVGQPNYGSLGADCHITFEVDSSLIDQPDELKAKIKKAYVLATAAVAEELARQSPPPIGRDEPEPDRDRDRDRPASRNGSANGSGYRKERHDWSRGGPGSAGTRTQERPRRDRDDRRSADRSGGGEGVPRSGSALIAWARDQEETGQARGLVKYLERWGNDRGIGWKLREWSRDDVGEAHTEALRWLGGDDDRGGDQEGDDEPAY